LLLPYFPPVERQVVSKILDLGNGMLQIDGYIVDRDVYRIMEKVKEYDPNLEVMFCDPNRAEAFDAPYIIVERCTDGLYRRVFEVWEFNDTVLERIYNADTRKLDVLGKMEQHNAKIRLDRDRRYKEEREEMKDMFAHLIANPKTSYTLPNANGDIVKIDDQHGVVKVNGQSVEG
jgi:hypothetical protein